MKSQIGGLKKEKYFILGLLSLVLTIVFLIYNLWFAKHHLVSQLMGNTWRYYLFMLLIILDVFFSVKDKKVCVLYVGALFCFFSWLSFADIYYSHIDEYFHFDNINCIVSNNKLKTFEDVRDSAFLNKANDGVDSIYDGVNYEAVQAPLYYLIFAIVGKFIDSAYLRYHIFRLLGLFLVLIVYYFVRKTIHYLVSNKVTSVNNELFRLGILLTVFNPAYLYRASRISNEILVCVLFAILLYTTVKCIIRGYNLKYYWALTIICAMLFLTKSTAIYAYVIVLTVIIMQKKIKPIVIPALVSSIPIIMWFAFNYKTYGSMTAMKEHLDIVIPISNPDRLPPDLFNAFFNLFAGTYFTGEEVAIPQGEWIWVNTVCIIALVFVVHIIKKIISDLKGKKVVFDEYDKKCWVNIICVILIISCIFCLAMGTISTKIVSLRGRYFYGPCIVFVVLLVLNNEFFTETLSKYILLICIIAVGIVANRHVNTYVDRVYTHECLFASEVNEIELADLTDDSWQHGYSRNGNSLLVEVNEMNKRDDFQILIDHPISNGHSYATITKVSDKYVVGEKEYIELYTNVHLDATISDDNHLIVKRACSLKNYNIGQIGFYLNSMEEQEISQTLQIKDDCSVWGIEVLLGTYGVENYSALVSYKIMDETGNEIKCSQQKLDLIQDTEYSRIYFDAPVEMKKGEKVKLSFIYDNDENLPITLGVSKHNTYPEGELYISGSKKKKLDMGIKLLVN